MAILDCDAREVCQIIGALRGEASRYDDRMRAARADGDDYSGNAYENARNRCEALVGKLEKIEPIAKAFRRAADR